MKSLLVTEESRGSLVPHRHIVYVNEDAPAGVVSEAEGHVHPVYFDEGGKAYLGPDMGDGHTHSVLAPYPAAPSKKKEDESEVIAMIYGLFKAAVEFEGKSIEGGLEAEKFYMGEQWDETLRSELEANDRACLTINLTERKLRDFLGYAEENKRDIRYLPMEGGDQKVADIYNIIAKFICIQNNADIEGLSIVEDQGVSGRGIFNLWVDFSKDVRGDIRIERFPWDGIVCGPHDRKDWADCEYVFKHRMISLAKLKSLYPAKAEDCSSDFSLSVPELDRVTPHVTYSDDQWDHAGKTKVPETVGSYVMYDKAKKERRLIECQQRVYDTTYVAVNPQDDYFETLYSWKAEDIEQVRGLPGFVVVERPITKIRITRVCGGVVLSDENPADLPYDDFYIVPAYASKRRERFWGLIEPVMDLQREINYRHSQQIDIGNKMIAYGWFYDATTFPDKAEERKFDKSVSSPGFRIKVNDVNRPPMKIEGAKFPTELSNLNALAVQDLEAMIGVIPNQEGANEPGVMMLHKERALLRGANFIFSNYALALQKVGFLLMHLIRRYYSPQRIARIVGSLPSSQQAQIGGQPASSYSFESIVEIMSNAEPELDVSVSQVAFSPTARLTTLSMVQDLIKSGYSIPPEVPLEFVDLPEDQKQRILQVMQAQSQAQAGAESAKQDAEIQKTLIAQGIIPPAVAEKYGVDQPQNGQQPPAQTIGGAGGPNPLAQ